MKAFYAFVAVILITACPLEARSQSESEIISAGRDAYFERDFKTAFLEWKKLAKYADPSAFYYLGILYTEGRGVKVDYKTASELFLKAASAGHILSFIEYASLLKKGNDDAQIWYDKAQSNISKIEALAESGDPFAQNTLGFMYNTGKGAPKDKDKALQWFKKAAFQGFAQSQYALGKILEESENGTQDELVLKWIDKAALQGLVSAQYDLGRKYQTGTGIPENQEKTEFWYKKAATSNHPDALFV